MKKKLKIQRTFLYTIGRPLAWLFFHTIYPFRVVNGRALQGREAPYLLIANHNHALFKGLGGSGGDVGGTVIVHGIAVQKATHSDSGVTGAVLGGEHGLNVRVRGQRTGFLDFVQLQIGNMAHHIAERFRIEGFAVKLAVRHDVFTYLS